MSWFWMNMPLAAAFFAAWVGVPMWLVLKHADRSPAPVAAQASVQARQAAAAEPQIADASPRAGQLVGVG